MIYPKHWTSQYTVSTIDVASCQIHFGYKDKRIENEPQISPQCVDPQSFKQCELYSQLRH